MGTVVAYIVVVWTMQWFAAASSGASAALVEQAENYIFHRGVTLTIKVALKYLFRRYLYLDNDPVGDSTALVHDVTVHASHNLPATFIAGGTMLIALRRVRQR